MTLMTKSSSTTISLLFIKKIIFFSSDEVANNIRKLPSRSASSPDNIYNLAYKYCSKMAILQISRILKDCTRFVYFLKYWKKLPPWWSPNRGMPSIIHKPLPHFPSVYMYKCFVLKRLKIPTRAVQFQTSIQYYSPIKQPSRQYHPSKTFNEENCRCAPRCPKSFW